MIFSKKKDTPPRERTIVILKSVHDGILSYSKTCHPHEAILVLKGKSKDGKITIDGLVVPPFSDSGPTFAGFPHSFLPFDKSYIGIFHSHTSGTAKPSITDLHNFFGLVSLITVFPYNDNDIHAWDSSGKPIKMLDTI